MSGGADSSIPGHGDILDKEKKHTNRFYGVAGMAPYTIIRGLCRQRLHDMDETRVRHEMDKLAVLCKSYEEIGMRLTGVTEKYLDKLGRWHATAVWGKKNPETVANVVRGTYKTEWVPDQGGHGPSPDEKPTCPYEDNPNNNACHGCHVARKVWDKLLKKAGEAPEL